jgi:hypothetical protein
MSTPEIIYLIKGEDDSDGEEIGMIWSDDPAPDSYSDPDEAVVYVRADKVEREQAEAVENAFMDLARAIRKERLHGISVKGLIHAAEEYAQHLHTDDH